MAKDRLWLLVVVFALLCACDGGRSDAGLDAGDSYDANPPPPGCSRVLSIRDIEVEPTEAVSGTEFRACVYADGCTGSCKIVWDNSYDIFGYSLPLEGGCQTFTPLGNWIPEPPLDYTAVSVTATCRGPENEIEETKYIRVLPLPVPSVDGGVDAGSPLDAGVDAGPMVDSGPSLAELLQVSPSPCDFGTVDRYLARSRCPFLIHNPMTQAAIVDGQVAPFPFNLSYVPPPMAGDDPVVIPPGASAVLHVEIEPILSSGLHEASLHLLVQDENETSSTLELPIVAEAAEDIPVAVVRTSGAGLNPDGTVTLNQPILLIGTLSHGTGEAPIVSANWSVLEKPAGSTAYVEYPMSLGPKVLHEVTTGSGIGVDLPGLYRFGLVVEDEGVPSSAADSAEVWLFAP